MATKQDTTVAAVVVLLILGGGGLALAASKKGKTPSSGPAPAPDDPPDVDGLKLQKRANQKAATDWASTFAESTSPLTAYALARWAGIESSGKATNHSRLDERGLMQAGPQSVAEGLLTPQEWAALISPATTRAEHARVAVKYVDGLARKAETYVHGMSPDPVDRVWFAKLWHQWPVDVRDEVGPLAAELHTTSAAALATALATRWATDSKKLHRLHAANVVAFGSWQPGGQT